MDIDEVFEQISDFNREIGAMKKAQKPQAEIEAVEAKRKRLLDMLSDKLNNDLKRRKMN